MSGLVCFLGAEAQAEIKFNRDIRPILSDNCFQCHGPDKDDRKADLRLDTAEGIIEDLGGYQAVIPGDPENSELYKRVTHSDPEEKMPPQEAHKIVSDQEIALLKQWIKEGAPWQDHWAFESIERPDTPKVSQPQWVSNPIDAFILKTLDEASLAPSTEADRRTLIRRVTFDLTGLPPTPEAVESFVADKSENAYEQRVDQLMSSTAYGEHQAHYWLDVARYADTHGFHLDNYRSIWPYRDWVVEAFNQNMPFDQFTIDQLAGDLLPDSTLEQKVATGFNRSNPTTSEGGAIDDEYFAIYAKDRAETTSAVWMGLTVGCATCHDHKYDPITQKEFYQFTAFFRNTTQPAMDGNAFDSPPSIRVTGREDQARVVVLSDEISALQAQYEADEQNDRDLFSLWRSQGGKIGKNIPIADQTQAFSVPLSEGRGSLVNFSSKGNKLSHKISGQVQWTKFGEQKALTLSPNTRLELGDRADLNLKDSFSGSFWIRVPADNDGWTTLFGRSDPDKDDLGWRFALNNKGRLQFVIKGEYKGENTGKHKPEFKAQVKKPLKADAWHHVVFNYDGGADSKTSLRIYVDGESEELHKLQSADFASLASLEPIARPFAIGKLKKLEDGKEKAGKDGDKGKDENKAKKNKQPASSLVGLTDLRLFTQRLSQEDINLLYAVPQLKRMTFLSDGKLGGAQEELAFDYYRSQVIPRNRLVQTKIKTRQAELSAINAKAPVTLVMEEKQDSEPQAHILNRGLYDNLGELVNADVPAMLPAFPEESAKNRLTLARWLVNKEHPLTARVTVNRFWQSLFGTGLVKTAGDFGSQGEPPSHPLLMDWLASEFMTQGWDMKYMMKLMVMSSTYRQSSHVTPLLIERDSENRLLARGPRYRLDAEVIRDQALYVSGLLVDKMGGPPVKPYQPQGLWKTVAYVGSNTMMFSQGHDEDLYRKSLYTFRKRTSAPPSMSIFDAPDRESCTVKRDLTNTPLQALLLMNDPQFVEAARNMAQNIIKSNTSDKYQTLLKTALGREPDPGNVAVLKETYDKVLTSYQANPESAAKLIAIGESKADETLDAVELATWTVLANQVFNLDEFISKN